MNDTTLGVITTTPQGEAQGFQGEKAVEVFRLATLISGLQLELRCPGMKMSRHMSALSAAKGITGLRTNNRQVQLERARIMLEQAKTEVIYVERAPHGEAK
jgi:hypothetical protein